MKKSIINAIAVALVAFGLSAHADNQPPQKDCGCEPGKPPAPQPQPQQGNQQQSSNSDADASAKAAADAQAVLKNNIGIGIGVDTTNVAANSNQIGITGVNNSGKVDASANASGNTIGNVTANGGSSNPTYNNAPAGGKSDSSSAANVGPINAPSSSSSYSGPSSSSSYTGPSSASVSGVEGGKVGNVASSSGPSTATTGASTATLGAVTTGPSTSQTGAVTTTTGATTTSASTAPVQVDTGHNQSTVTTRLQYVNMPSAPGVAQPVAGQGVLALPSVQAGPLKKMVRVPVEYVYKHWGKIEKFTMAGQFTEIEEDDFWVDPKDGKSYPYERVDNGDGTWSEWGTCYTKGGMVISNGMSTQNGLSLFGQSSGGNASTGQANLTTGVERMLNMGRCLHRTWGKQIVESTTTTQVIVSGPTKEQYENKIANLESHLNELLKHPVDKAVAPKPAAAKPATK